MPGVRSIAYPIVALLAWLLAAIKVRHVLRDRGDPSQRAMLAMFLFSALTVTVGSPPVRNAIDSHIRHGDSAAFCARSFAVAGMASALCLLVVWSYPPERAKRQICRRLILIAAALAAMITLYLTVDSDDSRFADHLARWRSVSPGYIAYLLVFQSVVAITVIDIARLCGRYGSHVKDRRVLTGLVTTAVGTLLMAAYSLLRAADVVCAKLGFAPPRFESTATLCGVVGAVLITAGLMFPSLAARAEASYRDVRRRRAYRQIEPLWYELVQAPGTLFEPHADTRPRAKPHGFESKLRRRVVEIHECEVALRPFRTIETASAARFTSEQRGMSGIQQIAFIEAVCLRAALAAKDANHLGDGYAPDYRFIGSDLDDELRWLVLLSKAFTQLRIHHGDRGAQS